ncbi:MAG: sugar transferase [Fulvivirga sp.]|nr:sugar transferase [Fulvivirga sp.]
MYRNLIKPFFDILTALILMLILSPIILLLIIVLSIEHKGSPFFIQPRPGYKGEVFHLIKFKTMNNKTDGSGNLLDDKYRLTSIGKFVRKYSLDELPQFINVIKGELSLVGPRPLLMKYLSLYNNYQKRRHEVRPGITGWAQVNGRNNVTWSQRFKHDIWYVDHQSFNLDIKIIFKTILWVIKGKDVSKDGYATMEEFKGN